MRNLRRSTPRTLAWKTAFFHPRGERSRHRLVLHLAWAAGLFLTAPGTAAGQGVCDRTPQVRDALVKIAGVMTCEEVTSEHLAGVTSLQLQWTRIDTLQAHDFSELSNLSRLELHYNSLTTLPMGIFGGLHSLSVLKLDNNSLTTLPVGIFGGLHNLSLLLLHDNSLTSLPEEIFRDTTRLGGLTMNGNSLTTLPVGIFGGLHNLSQLELQQNSLPTLPMGVFNGLGSLEYLHLGDNSLITLPERIFSELGNLRRLTLNGNSLTTLPVRIFSGPSSLESLSLVNNSITTLPVGVFHGLSLLSGLGLQDNSLTTLPVGIFRGMSNLSSLYLNNNSLTTLPVGVFDGLGFLKDLHLEHNPLTTLPKETFSEMKSLSQLELHHNALTTLPVGLFNGPSSLYRLSLDNNSLISLPEAVLSGLSSLGWLDLSGNSLTTLPEGVFREMTGLTSLGLDNNSLISLPEAVFSGLSSLGWLDLSGNSLTTLPEGVFREMTGLTSLRLDKNSLTTLPAGIFSGPSGLLVLTLNGNSLTTLPAGIFGELSKLLRLELHDNPFLMLPEKIFSGLSSLDLLHLSKYSLTTLPIGAFSELDTLYWLTVSGNSLTTLPTGVFNGLSNLDGLTLSDNSLITLPVGVFNGLSSLRLLDLSANMLTSLPEGVFNGLSSLRSLDLTSNSLTSWPEGLFMGMSDLVHLSLSGNSLTTLSEGTFSDLSSLGSLDLSGNSLASLPEELFRGIRDLTHLSLSANSLTTLPEGVFREMTGLTRLKLDKNSLTTLPAGIFSGLRSLNLLWLQENNLKHLPAKLFSGLDRLFILKLHHNSLGELPKGIFDDVLDTLGFWLGFRDAIPGELSLDTDLKAGLAFHSIQQRASEGTTVRVKVLLSRTLPVALRVPFTVGSSAAAYDHKSLSPSQKGGLLFLAGETSKEITFTLSETGGNLQETVVLTLAHLSEIGLRISDGTGPDAPELRANSFLKPAEEGSTHTVTIVSGGSVPDDPTPGPERDIFVPVILSSAGLNNSFFTSELTLTNRSSEPAVLNYIFTAHRGAGSGTATDTLPPGRQRIKTNAIEYLKSLGIPIPDSGKRIGTLRVQEASGSSEVGVMVRTTTAVSDGRAGLAYPGIPGDEGFQEAIFLCGLRQNQQDRSNVAFQNMGDEGSITMRTTVFSGDAANSSPRVLDDVTLRPGEFHQYTEVLRVLSSSANGYVKVERVDGTAPFYAYGVINDQANSDGSFVFPVSEGSLAGAIGQVLPVVVERSPFTSELTVTNFSNQEKAVNFSVVANAVQTEDHAASFPLQLKAGEQHIIPNVIDWARQLTSGIELPSGLASALFAEVARGDMSGIVIGARTGSQGSVGRYGVFYNAVPYGQSFTKVAWVDALQQNDENRSNLALVNTGEVDDSPSEFNLEIYNGETGLLVNTATGFRVPARHWYQIDGILDKYGMGTTQGYVRISKISGNNPFLAYGVINDGGTRLERSDDGAYLPARE